MGIYFGKWLRTQRVHKGFSVKDFAKNIGMSTSHLSQVEKRGKSLVRDRVSAVACALDADEGVVLLPWLIDLFLQFIEDNQLTIEEAKIVFQGVIEKMPERHYESDLPAEALQLLQNGGHPLFDGRRQLPEASGNGARFLEIIREWARSGDIVVDFDQFLGMLVRRLTPQSMHARVGLIAQVVLCDAGMTQADLCLLSDSIGSLARVYASRSRAEKSEVVDAVETALREGRLSKMEIIQRFGLTEGAAHDLIERLEEKVRGRGEFIFLDAEAPYLGRHDLTATYRIEAFPVGEDAQ